MARTIEISHRTVVFTVLFLGLIWFLIQIWPIIIGLFISLLLMTALTPLVDRLERFHIPRGLAILITYFILLGVFILGLASIVPPLLDQTTTLANRLPRLFDDLGAWLVSLGISGISGDIIAAQLSQVGAIPANLVRFTVSLFSNIIAVFTVLVITFYLLLERKNLEKYLVVLFGEGGEKRAKSFVDKLEARLGGWVRGELALMLIVGLLTYAGLRLLGIPFSLPLAILAGILEIVPNIGPTISAIPAVLVALTISPVMGVAVAALYFLVQQLENSIIVPKVMQRAAGVNPLATIISLAIGFKLAGALGAILSVPVVIAIHVTAVEFFSSRKLQQG